MLTFTASSSAVCALYIMLYMSVHAFDASMQFLKVSGSSEGSLAGPIGELGGFFFFQRVLTIFWCVCSAFRVGSRAWDVSVASTQHFAPQTSRYVPPLSSWSYRLFQHHSTCSECPSSLSTHPPEPMRASKTYVQYSTAIWNLNSIDVVTSSAHLFGCPSCQPTRTRRYRSRSLSTPSLCPRILIAHSDCLHAHSAHAKRSRALLTPWHCRLRILLPLERITCVLGTFSVRIFAVLIVFFLWCDLVFWSRKSLGSISSPSSTPHVPAGSPPSVAIWTVQFVRPAVTTRILIAGGVDGYLGGGRRSN